YHRAYAFDRTHWRAQGYARVVARQPAARALQRDLATVTYETESGPSSVFGETTVSGTKTIDPEIVRRELAYEPGDPFRQSRLDRTRTNLSNLNLFRTVRIDEDKSGDPDVNLHVKITEAPPR